MVVFTRISLHKLCLVINNIIITQFSVIRQYILLKYKYVGGLNMYIYMYILFVKHLLLKYILLFVLLNKNNGFH